MPEAPTVLPALSRDEADRQEQVFRHLLLLFEAQCHLGEVRRILTDDGIPTGGEEKLLNVPGYRLAVYFQIAIETVFQNPETARFLRQDRSMTLWVTDALYGVARMWQRDKSELVFEEYFKSLRSEALGIKNQFAEAPVERWIEKHLTRHVMELIAYLEYPERLLAAVEAMNSARKDTTKSAIEISSENCVKMVIQSTYPLLEMGNRIDERFTLNWTFTSTGDRRQSSMVRRPDRRGPWRRALLQAGGAERDVLQQEFRQFFEFVNAIGLSPESLNSVFAPHGALPAEIELPKRLTVVEERQEITCVLAVLAIMGPRDEETLKNLAADYRSPGTRTSLDWVEDRLRDSPMKAAAMNVLTRAPFNFAALQSAIFPATPPTPSDPKTD